MGKQKQTKSRPAKASAARRQTAAAAAAKGRSAASSAPVAKAREQSSPKACALYYVNGDIPSQARLVLALRGLLRHTPADLDIVVACESYLDGVRRAIADDLGDRKYTEIYDMEDALAELGITSAGWRYGNWPFGVIFRLGIPLHPAFAGYDRVLSLDLDVIVSSDSAKDLAYADLTGCEARGAPDVSWLQGRVPDLYSKAIKPEYAERLKSVLGTDMLVRPYVNSGVLLWNIPEIRKDLDWYKERLTMYWEGMCQGKYGYPQQDFINSMMRVRADLSRRFNTIYTTGQHEKGDLTHYVGAQYGEFLASAFTSGLLESRKGE